MYTAKTSGARTWFLASHLYLSNEETIAAYHFEFGAGAYHILLVYTLMQPYTGSILLVWDFSKAKKLGVTIPFASLYGSVPFRVND